MGARIIEDGGGGHVLSATGLLRLLQLTSPTLPIGAYAYSQGLETAVDQGLISDAQQTRQWLEQMMTYALTSVDLPVLIRLHGAWSAGDRQLAERWNATLLAMRESRELREEDIHLGQALMKLLNALADTGSGGGDLISGQNLLRTPSLAAAVAVAAAHWEIPASTAALAYTWMWAENLVAAAVKLIPLGQTAGQRILSALQSRMPEAVAAAAVVKDSEIGLSLPGVAMVSGWHETQYVRLFRS